MARAGTRSQAEAAVHVVVLWWRPGRRSWFRAVERPRLHGGWPAIWDGDWLDHLPGCGSHFHTPGATRDAWGGSTFLNPDRLDGGYYGTFRGDQFWHRHCRDPHVLLGFRRDIAGVRVYPSQVWRLSGCNKRGERGVPPGYEQSCQ